LKLLQPLQRVAFHWPSSRWQYCNVCFPR
jgi:hypothetical protein